MTRFQRVRYEMFLRVRDFGITHRDLFPESSRGGRSFAKVAEATSLVETHSVARLLAAHDGRRGKAAARAVVRRWMLSIARTARDVARTTSGGNRKLRMPHRTADVALLTSARMFLDDGAPLSGAFIELGLPANWVSEFRAAVDTFEDQLRGRRAGRSGVAAANAGIKAALKDGFIAIHTLDVIIANTLTTDPVLLAVWARGRRIVEGMVHRKVALVAEPTMPDAGTTLSALVLPAAHPGAPADAPTPPPLVLPTMEAPLELWSQASPPRPSTDDADPAFEDAVPFEQPVF